MNNRDKIILIVLLIIAIAPLSLGIFGGAFGLSVAAITIILGILLAPWLCAIALGIVGVSFIVVGVMECFVYLGTGFIYIGIGFIITSLAVIFEKFASWLYKGLFRPCLNKFVDAFHKEGRTL